MTSLKKLFDLCILSLKDTVGFSFEKYFLDELQILSKIKDN